MEVCLHDVMQQTVKSRNEQFVYAFVDVNVVSGNDAFDVRFCKPMTLCTTGFSWYDFPAFSVRFSTKTR